MLTIDYGRGTGPDHVQFANGVEPDLQQAVQAFFASHDAYAEYREEDGSDADIRVHKVHARRLAEPDAIDAELDARLNATSPPRETGETLADCGTPIVEVWPEPGRVRFGCELTTEGWDEVWLLMQDLDGWARGASPGP